MEKPIQIVLNLLNNQEILGKEYLSISEIKEILYDVDKMFNVNIEKDIENDFATKEQRDTFNDIMNKITVNKIHKENPVNVYYMVGNSIYVVQDTITGDVYIRYSDFWEVFETKFKLNYKEIRELIQRLLEEHFKCNINTTQMRKFD